MPEPTKLWLWKNFVDGRPEYWAFDNPYPCATKGGDPLVLGEPCGYALLKESVNGRPGVPEPKVIDAIKRARPTIDELEAILKEDADEAIEILPNGEIRRSGRSVAEGVPKPLTMRDNLGGEYA